MSSAPLTPRTPRRKTVRNIAGTPKSLLKRTILNFDPNLLYLEDDDVSYVNETTEISFDEEEEEYDEGELDGDLLPSVEESEDSDADVTDGLVPVATREPTAAERALFEEEDVEARADVDAAVAGVDGGEGAFKKFLVKHEVIRKALHSSIGFFTLWLYTLGFHQTQIILPLATLFAVIFANDFIRFRNPELNKKIVRNFWFLIRDREEAEYNGTLYFLVGLIIVFSLCPKDISLMSVLLLSWADTAASTFGRQFGKYTPKLGNGKSLAGSLASFATGIISCYVLYGYFIPAYNDKVNVAGDIMWSTETSKLSLPIYAFFAGLIASVSELIDVGGIDDNFTVPVLSGGFLYVLVKYFQI